MPGILDELALEPAPAATKDPDPPWETWVPRQREYIRQTGRCYQGPYWNDLPEDLDGG